MTLVRRRLAPSEIDHERLWLGVAAMTAIAITILAAGVAAPLSVCPLKVVTGWPCLGCGTTRALSALALGEIRSALRWNPLATLGVLASVVWLCQAAIVLLCDLPRWRLTFNLRDLQRGRWLTGVVVLTTWLFLIVDGR